MNKIKCLRIVMLALIAIASGLFASPAHAWNDSGHMQVAVVAYRRLPANVRQRLVNLLKEHPRYAQDFTAKKPSDLGGAEEERQWIFAHAATWPDIARDEPAYHHPTWHYINEPIYLGDADRSYFEAHGIPNNVSHDTNGNTPFDKLNAVQAIAYAKEKVLSTSTSKTDRALYLTWLMHLVGDIHQPLHSVALYSRGRFPEGDRGGNEIMLGETSLHSTCDALVGTSSKIGYLNNRVTAYLKVPELKQAGADAANDLFVDTWVEESHEHAVEFAYDAAILTAVGHIEASGSKAKPTVDLPQSYYNDGRARAKRRIVEAGFRLAALLANVSG